MRSWAAMSSRRATSTGTETWICAPGHARPGNGAGGRIHADFLENLLKPR